MENGQLSRSKLFLEYYHKRIYDFPNFFTCVLINSSLQFFFNKIYLYVNEYLHFFLIKRLLKYILIEERKN